MTQLLANKSFQLIIVMITISVVAFSVGRYSKKTPISVKIVEVEHKVVVDHKNVVTTVTKTTSPGQCTNPPKTVVTTVTVDNSVITTKDDTDRETKVVYKQPDWLVSVGKDLSVTTKTTGYVAGVQRRVLGPIYLGVGGSTLGYGVLNIGVQF